MECSLMTEPVRLAKRLAEMVSCSRREAELYIEGGWVTVEGKVVQEPQFRVAGHEQKIELHPDASLAPVEMVTILLHQTQDKDARPPIALISLDTHAADDSSGIRPLQRHFSRLTPTLPLEANASGLLVLTQDWRVVRKLVDDAATVEQEYVVEVEGELGPHGLKQLNHGLSLDGRALPPAKVSWQNETRLRFAVKGAKPGQIAHMCQSVGLQVKSMKRLRIGKGSMAKLPPGQWRYLPADERF
jgi:23S rRNA pseudouridine2604 synthase